MPAAAVTPTNQTTARQNISDALVAVLVAFQTAHPTLLRQVWSSRPGSFPETPAAYIGGLDEQLVHTAGTRQRIFSPTVIIVDKLIDNIDTGNRLDVLVDYLVEWFTANVSIVTDANSVRITALIQVGGSDGEETLDGPTASVHYANHTFSFGQTVVQEGRN